MKALESLELSQLRSHYRTGELTPQDMVTEILERLAVQTHPQAWIYLLPEAHLMARAEALRAQDLATCPLYGIPFAVKDNIDVAGYPTTAACPEFAYLALESAPVVDKLLEAGAILVGKTNMDQFATGLVGVRSPYGPVPNAFNDLYIAGGSSAGSAVAVATGLVSFALGTDTAGSGRVPAAFNNIVGLKPTRGLLSTRGVVPACRSLDCVSIFALSTENAWDVLRLTAAFDPEDPFCRPESDHNLPDDLSTCRAFRFGIPAPEQTAFFGDTSARAQFDWAVQRLMSIGGEPQVIDFAPFIEAAALLYDGPWVAERYLAIQGFMHQHPEALHPVTRTVIATGTKPLATDVFSAYYRLKELRRCISTLWEQIDVLVTPTAGTIFTIAQVEADPIRLNTQLGYYTNFMNLLDLSAIAIPAGFLDCGLPFGITLSAPPFSEPLLCTVGESAHRTAGVRMGATAHALPPATRRKRVSTT